MQVFLLVLVLLCPCWSVSAAWAQERGVIESPSDMVSGIGFISGWKCHTQAIELWLTGEARKAC